MASKRFEIDMALNASDVAKGAKDGEKALRDLDDAVGEVADASDKAGGQVNAFAEKLVDASRKAGKSDDDIKDALRNMGLSARQAERAVENVGDEFKETGRAGERAADDLEDSLRDVQKQSKRTEDAMDDIGDTTKKAFGNAEDGLKDFKQEANQTARESAASFDGSAESIVDAFQEIAANSFSGFGPAGAVAGLAAAAGIGLAMSGFENVQEAEEESRKRAGEWAQAYIEAGGKVLNAAITTAKGLDIAQDPDRYTEATENAKNWGVDVSTAIAAMTGEAWALKAANDSLSESEQKIASEMEDVGLQFDWSTKSMSDLGVETLAGRDALSRITDEMTRGGQQADAYSSYLAQVAENTEGATTKVDEFGDRITTLPDGTTIYIDAETGQATVDTDAIEKKIYGIQDKTVTIEAATGQALSAVQSAINQINSMTAYVNVRANVYEAISTVQNIKWD